MQRTTTLGCSIENRFLVQCSLPHILWRPVPFKHLIALQGGINQTIVRVVAYNKDGETVDTTNEPAHTSCFFLTCSTW